MKKKQQKPKKVLSLEDAAHFIIYRELHKMGVLFPYKRATLIVNELKEVVSYRAPKI